MNDENSDHDQLELFNGKVVCPRCDGNGLIYKANTYICDECDALWIDRKNINAISFKDLATFLEEKGYTYKDSKLMNLGYDWYEEKN